MSSSSSSKPGSLDSATGAHSGSPPPTSPTPLLGDGGHVSVARAEAAFRAVESELKETLHRSQSLARVTSRASRASRGAGDDVEKGVALSSDDVDDAGEPFDLEATLRGDRAAAEAAGLSFKEIGVLWRGLTVRGAGAGGKAFVSTFPSAFVRFFNIWPRVKKLLCIGNSAPQVEILKDFRGLVRPGEMVLVLGRPGSGCTTFLKVISNQRFGYTNIDGEVLYGPFDHETFSKRYRGEAVYNAEDESQSMHPTLTVRQTLDFALDTKVPGSRPAGLSRKDFKVKVIDMLLKMFNIEVSFNSIFEPHPISVRSLC
jgi:ABC-type glutathione transport system ATPase component